jgi:hypothetical protein
MEALSLGGAVAGKGHEGPKRTLKRRSDFLLLPGKLRKLL